MDTHAFNAHQCTLPQQTINSAYQLPVPLETKSLEMPETATSVTNAQLDISQMLLEDNVKELDQSAHAHKFTQKMDSTAKNVQTTCLLLMETLNVNKLLALIQTKYLESHKTVINAELAMQELFQIV